MGKKKHDIKKRFRKDWKVYVDTKRYRIYPQALDAYAMHLEAKGTMRVRYGL